MNLFNAMIGSEPSFESVSRVDEQEIHHIHFFLYGDTNNNHYLAK